MPTDRYVDTIHHLVEHFDPADDGWYYPVCTCGWTFGPLPDLETAIDALMEHAQYANR